ncbi:GNAT family N-acetyltransferase [Pyxidicoccus fallax]|uniref:GNAT family N-acetyltransferase n=1 Tax=Pyxidicoccus fallax TaxID=394095 RepID=A0A848L9X0_9BACT|nr:GNAT family N-acetyltransferase [Pyxidicoccus fallax]NMO13473.1 GNAT family N-acetyltransferase [Pyxidicoccus fallax]NPC82714.1 GNAT family N-acetyltransferase [Pyxidicoccus fallax]
MSRWQWKSFRELTLDELYTLLALRQEVFVVEQRSIYQDADGLDREAAHLLAFDEAEGTRYLAAYLRVLPPGVKFPDASSLGRVVTAPRARGRGLGRDIVVEGIARLDAEYPEVPIRISAQHYLQRFYESLGFHAEGDVYDEDGVPHIEMVRPAARR